MKANIRLLSVSLLFAILSFINCGGSDGGGGFSAGDMKTYTAEDVSFNTVYVPGGLTFPIGTSDAGTATIEDAYWIGETEITYELWKAAYDWAITNGYEFENQGRMGSVPDGTGMTDQHPVTMVSWRDAVIWCNALSEIIGVDPVYVANGEHGTTLNGILRSSVTDAYGESNGKNLEDVLKSEDDNLTRSGFRLLTSKEWECAARYKGNDSSHGALSIGGKYWTPGRYASGGTGPRTGTNEDDYPHFDPFAWYGGSTESPTGNTTTTQAVAQKTENRLGLCDMSGNVFEWCFTEKMHSDNYYRVVKGGAWHAGTIQSQVGYDDGIDDPDAKYNNFGFRIGKTQ